MRYQLQWQKGDSRRGMETQSEIDEAVLSNVVESLLGKIRTNLDISMQVLEAVRNEQSVQLRKPCRIIITSLCHHC